MQCRKVPEYSKSETRFHVLLILLLFPRVDRFALLQDLQVCNRHAQEVEHIVEPTISG